MKKRFVFELPSLEEYEFPYIEKPANAVVSVKVNSDQHEIVVEGNSAGLLYLARHIAAMGMMSDKVPGFHHHLSTVSGELEDSIYEVTLANTDNEKGSHA